MARREVHHGHDLSPDELRRRIAVHNAGRRMEHTEIRPEIDVELHGGNARLREVAGLDDAAHPQVNALKLGRGQRLVHGPKIGGRAVFGTFGAWSRDLTFPP